MKRYLIVFGAPFDTKEEAEQRKAELEEETGYSFDVVGSWVPEPTAAIYLCKMCGDTFDTSTAQGKMHMSTRHGRNLKSAIKEGLVERK